MARKGTWLGAAWLVLASLLGNRSAVAAESAPQRAADPAVWGIYARLVGTTWDGEGGKAEWQWGPDGSIVEHRMGRVGKVMRPGAAPGKLFASYGGKRPELLFEGHVAADGSVVWISTLSRSAPIWREAIVDGRYRDERVKLDDANQVIEVKRTYVNHQTGGTPVTEVAIASSSSSQAAPAPAAGSAATASNPPAPSAATAAALPATAPAPDPSAAELAAQAPAAPVEPPIDPVQLKQRNAVIHEYYERAINGPDGTPGAWLELSGSGSGISRYRRTEEGVEGTFSFIRENGELAVNQSIVHFDHERGRLIRYVDGEPAVAAEIVRLPDGAFRVQTLPGFGVSEAEAAASFNDVAFVADRQEIRDAKGGMRAYRWVPESEAADVQASIQKRQAWLETQRVVAARAEAEAEAKRQREAAEAEATAALYRQQEAAEQERLAYEAEADAEFEMERQQRAALWEQARAASEQGLADSISRLNNTVASVEAQQAQYRAQQQALQARQEASARAADAQRAREATERQYEIARQNEARRAAAAAASTPGLTVASTPASAPASAPAAAGGGSWFVFCVAIKPGAYMDAPGALFLSGISAIDKAAYSNADAVNGFASRVNAQYGTSVGSSSCNALPDRATAQARWQEQHDSAGLASYRKVVTGIPATP